MRPSAAWNFVLRNSLRIPYVRVDRESFLRTELSRYADSDRVDLAIAIGPSRAGIPIQKLDSIATRAIESHLMQVSALSFTVGIPGGWWMLGTVPADLAQFYWHVLVILQKLAYLYGWPELFSPDDLELGDDELLLLTLFVGSMFGVETSRQALATMAEALAQHVVTRLPEHAVRHWGVFTVAQSVGRMIGMNLTREGFSRTLSKVLPIVGGIVSGVITYYSFKPMAYGLKKHLRELALAKMKPKLLLKQSSVS